MTEETATVPAPLVEDGRTQNLHHPPEEAAK